METIAYEELLREDGKVMTHVVGASMRPMLLDRESIVLVEAVDRVPPRRGDVVLYKAGDKYLLHRILQISPVEYLIRGDNTRTVEHIPKKALLATMTGFYRHPESRFVARNDAIYRLYCLSLPGIRFTRRLTGKIRRIHR